MIAVESSAGRRARRVPRGSEIPGREFEVRVLDNDPFQVLLSGSRIARACRKPTRRELIDRLFAIPDLKSLQLDCRRKRLRLEFATAFAPVRETLAAIGEAMRHRSPRSMDLRHEDVFLNASIPAAVEIRRWKGRLTFWKIDAPSSRIFYLSHPLLKGERARRAVIDELGTFSDAVQRVIPLGESLMVIVRPFRMEADIFPEALDPVLTRALAGDDAAYSPKVQDSLVNANLALAPVADFLLPPVGLANAALTGALTQKSIPYALSELKQGKITLHSLNVLIAGLTIFAFEFLPAALMYWLARFWSKQTQRLYDVHRDRLLSRYRRRPPRVWIEEGGISVEVALEKLSPASVITLTAGDIVPVDGNVVSGDAGLDEQLLTGRAEPVTKEAGDTVFAGTQILDGTLQIRASAVGKDTASARLTEKLRDLLARTSAASETVSRLQADRAVVPTLVASVGALLTGGLGGFRAALRPDFLTGPAIAEEMGGLTAVIHAANEGVIWGERPALDILRTADYYVFDDSVEWSEDKRARDEFRSATRGLGEPVLFTSLSGDDAAAKAGRLGFRVFRPDSTPEDVVQFLEEKRAVDQPAVYVGAGDAEGAASALHVVVVSPPFDKLAGASLALLSPDLGKFGLLLNLAWQTRQDSEKAFRLTLLPNIAAIAAAIFMRSPAMASVVLTNLGTLTNYVRSAAILQLASSGGSRRRLS
jgi:hypothetical protein